MNFVNISFSHKARLWLLQKYHSVFFMLHVTICYYKKYFHIPIDFHFFFLYICIKC